MTSIVCSDLQCYQLTTHKSHFIQNICILLTEFKTVLGVSWSLFIASFKDKLCPVIRTFLENILYFYWCWKKLLKTLQDFVVNKFNVNLRNTYFFVPCPVSPLFLKIKTTKKPPLPAIQSALLENIQFYPKSLGTNKPLRYWICFMPYHCRSDQALADYFLFFEDKSFVWKGSATME